MPQQCIVHRRTAELDTTIIAIITRTHRQRTVASECKYVEKCIIYTWYECIQRKTDLFIDLCSFLKQFTLCWELCNFQQTLISRTAQIKHNQTAQYRYHLTQLFSSRNTTVISAGNSLTDKLSTFITEDCYKGFFTARCHQWQPINNANAVKH